MINSKVDTRLKSRRGALLVFAAVSMVGVLGLLAIAVDIGAGVRQKRIAQTAADAAAIGGGRQIERHGDSASVVAYAFNSALRNQFPASAVQVFYPPQTGNHIGDKNFVEVRIAKPIATLIGTIFNIDSLHIQTRAVAGLGSFSTNCVVNLASYPSLGINWDGKMTTNCTVSSNGSIDLQKGIDGYGNTEPDVSAVGTVDGGNDGHTFSGVPPAPDPYSYMTAPPDPLLQVPAGTTDCNYYNKVVSANETLYPGVYCGGITVNDNILATLTPGVYIVRGGGVTGGQIEGWGGVTIINTNGPGGIQTQYKPFTFGNNCKFHIQAPGSGVWKGVAVFVDPAAPESPTENDYVNDLCGKGVNTPCSLTDVDIEGLAYMPKQSFNVGNSNAKLTIAGTLISKFMTSHPGAEGCFFLNTSGSSTLLRLSLVE